MVVCQRFTFQELLGAARAGFQNSAPSSIGTEPCHMAGFSCFLERVLSFVWALKKKKKKTSCVASEHGYLAFLEITLLSKTI